MKLVKLKPSILFVLISALCISCSSDDTEETNTIDSDSFLDPNEVSKNVTIQGSTFINSSLPIPNENIAFTFNEDAAGITLPIEGFDIAINSDDDLVGAYIQFINEKGEVSDGYFDVNLQQNTTGKLVNKKVSSSKTNRTIDIDFTPELKTGTFCYRFCVYDNNGNISSFQKACTTIQLLGGDSALTGEFSFVRRHYFPISDLIYEPFIYEVGDVVITFKSTRDCPETGEPYTITEERVQDSGKLTLNRDGTYIYEDNSIRDRYDIAASLEVCAPVGLEKIYIKFQNTGVWSYIEEEKRLVLISYRRFRLENDEVAFDQHTEPGNGILFWDTLVEFNNSEVLIKNGDGLTEDSVWYTYVKN